MSLCIVYSTTTVRNANLNNLNNLKNKLYICRDYGGLGLDETVFAKSVIVFIFLLY